MTTTQERPVISDEKLDEDATVRLSDFNDLKEMFHELKDKFESLKKEEPGTFHNWNELFVSFMMSIDRKWELISTTLQRKDTAFLQEDVSCIQDELKMPLEKKAWPITPYM